MVFHPRSFLSLPSLYHSIYSPSRRENSSNGTPVQSLPSKKSHLSVPKNPSARALSGLRAFLDRVPHLVGATAGALKETVVALDLCHLLPGVELHKLRVLVGGEHEEILLGENGVKVLVGLVQRGVERGVEEGGEVSPARLGGGPAVERPLESALETVAFGKFAEIPAIGRVVLVVEVAAARRGEPGGPTCQHAIGFLDHAGEVLDLLVVGLGLAVTQLVGRAAAAVGCLKGKRSVGELDNELLVQSHWIPSFGYYKQVSIKSIYVDFFENNEQL